MLAWTYRGTPGSPELRRACRGAGLCFYRINRELSICRNIASATHQVATRIYNYSMFVTPHKASFLLRKIYIENNCYEDIIPVDKLLTNSLRQKLFEVTDYRPPYSRCMEKI
jgi:hypothetical protein